MALPECPLAAIGAILDAPECGHFAIRLGRRQPWTPALIFSPCPFVECDPYSEYFSPEDCCAPLDRSPYPLRAQVGERIVEDGELLIKIWQGARAVTVAEHAYLVARRAWARRYEPNSYHAQPVSLGVLKNRELLG